MKHLQLAYLARVFGLTGSRAALLAEVVWGGD